MSKRRPIRCPTCRKGKPCPCPIPCPPLEKWEFSDEKSDSDKSKRPDVVDDVGPLFHRKV